MALDKNDKSFIQNEIKISGDETRKELRKEIQTSSIKIRKELKGEILTTSLQIKKDLRGEILNSSKKIRKELRGEIQLAVERSEERVVNVLKDFIEVNNRNLLDEFYDRIDPILMEVQASREERSINAKNISKNSEILASHEKRINKLELVK